MNSILRCFASVTLAVVLLSTLGGCISVNFNNTPGLEQMKGSGPMTTVEYQVGAYTAAEVSDKVEVIYSATASDTVRIDIQENLVPHMMVEVKDGALVIDFDRELNVTAENTPRIYLSNPNLKKLVARGSMQIKEADTIKGESFSLLVSGACDINLDLDVDKLTANISGAGNMQLSGRADETEMRISGSGSINALELESKDCTANFSGVGNGSISCSDTLKVTISGSGSFTYKGDPEVEQKIAGAGSVQQLG